MVHANDIVARFDQDQILAILRHFKAKIEDGKKKGHYVEQVREVVENKGIKELLSATKLADLLEIAQPLIDNNKINVENANKHNKPVLVKRLKDLANEDGLDSFFDRRYDVNQLKAVLETFGDDSSSNNKDTLVRQAAEATRKAGLSIVLSNLPVGLLKDIASDAKLKVHSESAGVLVEAIVTGHAPERRAPPPRQETKFSKEKKDLKKGITYQDIFQHYNKDELEDFARKEGIKVSGKKPDLIKRILRFLDGDVESTKVQPKRKAEGDAPAEKKEKKAKKSGSKKEKTPKSPKSPSKSKKSKKSEEESVEAAASK